MIAIYLPSFPFRGAESPYLWFFYKALSSIKEPLGIISTKKYFTPLDVWEKEGRWEVSDDGKKRMGYDLPDFSDRKEDRFLGLEEASLYEMLENYHGNSTKVFESFLTKLIPGLYNEFVDVLKTAVEDIECIITICNCPSLREAAKIYGIPVIHIEIGPLRSPEYYSTGYFDFSGVNGNTEAKQRYLNAQSQNFTYSENTSIKNFRDFFTKINLKEHEKKPMFDFGIALQVESDSNLIAFSNGFNNQSLLNFSDKFCKGDILVRGHPGSLFQLRQNTPYTIDNNKDIINFIMSCEKILTINSSVGLESMLWEVPLTCLGDSSYLFCNVDDIDDRTERLAFYLFNYLVPYELILNPTYIRFRLSQPLEREILERHISYYMLAENNLNIDLAGKTTAEMLEISMSHRNLLKEIEILNIKNIQLEEILNIKNNQLEEILNIKNNQLEEVLNAQQAYEENNNILVDVIVPVYAGLEETRECILSALATLPVWAELIVINDASPEPELTNWLRQFAPNNFRLLENDQNLGFVATVNRGMKLNLNRDILLLNSDVEVANNWLERIYDAAYSRERVGSITPFSNNATICSFPNFCEDNELLFDLSVQQIDDQFEGYGKENNLVEIPTGVGFCMYIRRDCLQQIGYFNEEAFGRGYGEENDWCQRAAKAGWPNYHQLNVFVYHKGGVSFAEEQNPRKLNAMKILSGLHPNYTQDVMDYVALDPVKPIRLQMMLRFLSNSTLPKILLISHNLGGGTQFHLEELSDFYKDNALFLILKPDNQTNTIMLSFSVNNEVYKENITINIENEYHTLIRLLEFIGISHIHFHHLIGIPNIIQQIHLDLNCSYDVTIHDYYTINGNPSLTNESGVFVGDNNFDMLSPSKYLSQEKSIDEWRIGILKWLDGANRIIFPSADVKCRLINYYPMLVEKSIISWHPDFENDTPYPEVKVNYDGTKKLKILVLGAISLEKGSLMLQEVANRLKRDNVEFHLLGYSNISLNDNIVCHGAYLNKNVVEKINEISPDIMWFPAQWAETYSYTLSTALKLGIPVVVPNIGAFSERVLGRKYSRVIDWDISTKRMSELWRCAIADLGAFFRQPNVKLLLDTSLEKYEKNFYKNKYMLDIELKDGQLGRVDVKSLVESCYSSQDIILSRVSDLGPQGRKERLLAILWNLRQTPLFSWMIKLIPYSFQRYIKGKLSKRSLYDIVS